MPTGHMWKYFNIIGSLPLFTLFGIVSCGATAIPKTESMKMSAPVNPMHRVDNGADIVDNSDNTADTVVAQDTATNESGSDELTDAPCRLILPPEFLNAEIGDIPYEYLVRVIMPAYDSRVRARHLKHMDDETLEAASCRNQTVVVYVDEPSDEGSPVLAPPKVVKQSAEGGRLLVRLMVAAEIGAAPFGEDVGFIAILSKKDNMLAVDSVAPWDNGSDVLGSDPITPIVRQMLNGQVVWVEPTGHTGTGGGGDDVGERLWIEHKGELKNIGGYETSGYAWDSDDAPYVTGHFETDVTFSPNGLLLKDTLRWECEIGGKNVYMQTTYNQRNRKIVNNALTAAQQIFPDWPICYNGKLFFKGNCQNDRMCAFKLFVQKYGYIVSAFTDSAVRKYTQFPVVVTKEINGAGKQQSTINATKDLKMVLDGLLALDFELRDPEHIAKVQYEKKGSQWLTTTRRQSKGPKLSLVFAESGDEWILTEIIEQ